MGISTKILTTSGLIKIPLPPIDTACSKIRVYSLKDQTPETLKKVKEALAQEKQKERIFKGNLSNLDQDILTKPYLFKDKNNLILISYETMISLKQGTLNVSQFVQTELSKEVIYQKAAEKLAFENRHLDQISNLSQIAAKFGHLKYFTGREKELNFLEKNLFKVNSESSYISQRIVITGLGGYGKSTLALQYAKAYAGQYDIIYWIPAEEKTKVQEELEILAQKLKIVGSDRSKKIDDLYLKLKTSSLKTLLVFDGIVQEDLFQNIIDAIPRCEHIHLLCTTIFPQIQNYSCLCVKPFSFQESLSYFQQILNLSQDQYEKEKNHLEELVKECGSVPLALNFAARGMLHEHPFFSENSNYKELSLDVQNKVKMCLRNQDILKPISYEKIINSLEQKYPDSLSRTFLHWISALRGELIPEEILKQLFAHVYPEREQCDFTNALNHLIEYLLIEKDSAFSTLNYYKANHLIKKSILNRLSTQEQSEFCILIKSKVAKQLNDLRVRKDCIQEYSLYRDHYLGLLRMPSIQLTMTPLERYTHFLNVGNLFYKDQLYPQTLLCFTDAWESLQLMEKIDLNYKFQILNRLGIICQKLDNFHKASGYYEDALVTAQQLEDAKEQLKLHHILRDIYDSLKEHQQAIGHAKQALNIAKKLDDVSEQRKIYSYLGEVYYISRDYYKKIECHEKELELAIRLKDPLAEEKAYGNLGDSYDALGFHDNALKYYQRHLEIIEKFNDDKTKGKIYGNLGSVYDSLGHRQEAVDYHRKALEIAKRLMDHKEEGRIYGNLGHAYRSLGDTHLAIESYEKALEIANTIHDSEEEERAYINLGNMYRSLKKYQEALNYHNKALEIATKFNNFKKIGQIYSRLGNVFCSLGQYSDAFSCHHKALKIAQDLSDDFEEGRIYRSLGAVYNTSGDPLKAIENYKRALDIAKKFNHLIEEERSYSQLGGIYNSLGIYDQAIEHHKSALNIALQLNNPVIKGRSYINLGIVYHSLGDIHQAIEHYNNCLAIVLQLKDSAEEGRTYCNLGNAYDSLGEYHKAIFYHEKDLAIALELKDLMAEQRAYNNLGIVYESLRKYSEAINYQENALKIALDLNNHRDEGKICGNLGNIYGALGNYSKAINYQENALKIALDLNNHRDEGKFCGNLGNIYGALGNYEMAIQSYEKSLEIAQKLKDRIGEGVTYGNLGNIYGALGEYSVAEEYLRKSIQVAAIQQEQMKNFEWQITFFEEQSKQYLSLELLLLMQNKFVEALEISDERRARALASLISQKKFPDHNKALFLESLTVQKMQELAKKLETTFIVYSLVDINQLIQVWIISSMGSTLIPITLPSAKDEFHKLHEIFKKFPYKVDIKRPKKGEKQSTELFQEKLSTCYHLLIEPLIAHLPLPNSGKTLTIIPDGFLAHLPFGAFYNAQQDQYLIENYPISIAPSIQVLSLLDQLPTSLSNSALLIGKNRKIDLDYSEENEVHNILAPLFKESQKEVFHEKATPVYLLEKAPIANWIHIACYSVTNVKSSKTDYSHSVFDGTFQLAPDDQHPLGYLHSKEIASLSLKADLVFMTASQLGLGNLQQEGSIGPVWSFLGAGALSTIASYWTLPEGEVTTRMVETFYKYYLGIDTPKLSKAKALQQAVLMVMKTERHNPRQWGGFFLSGLIK